jgi:hypothetical protein
MNTTTVARSVQQAAMTAPTTTITNAAVAARRGPDRIADAFRRLVQPAASPAPTAA